MSGPKGVHQDQFGNTADFRTLLEILDRRQWLVLATAKGAGDDGPVPQLRQELGGLVAVELGDTQPQPVECFTDFGCRGVHEDADLADPSGERVDDFLGGIQVDPARTGGIKI